MKVLVVGGGGREHALCWKIAQSPLVSRVYCAPGNAGIAEVAECVDLAPTNLAGLRSFASDESVELTVVGPEEPLCLGIVDFFQQSKLRIFGPNKIAAEIEGSKAFARQLCRRHKIPGPGFAVFENSAAALAYLENRGEGPIVVKASGLAQGKGVVMAKTLDAARAAVRGAMDNGAFGAAGATVVLEDWVEGKEVSSIALTDGQTIVPLETVRDHKKVRDNDEGPNTGGMGAFSPVGDVGTRIQRQIENTVLIPSIHAMNREGRTFRGFLYAGLMLNASGPRVLEFNCRLGDPETQPLLMRMQSDLVPLLMHAADGTLDQMNAPVWDPRMAVCVVACSGGYPGEYRKGLPIHGLDQVELGPDLQVFHSGTLRRGSDLVSNGGRVFSVCALGSSADEARTRVYAALARIEFQGMHYRRDIALPR